MNRSMAVPPVKSKIPVSNTTGTTSVSGRAVARQILLWLPDAQQK